MTGLKSGSGDDLWDDPGDDEGEDDAVDGSDADGESAEDAPAADAGANGEAKDASDAGPANDAGAASEEATGRPSATDGASGQASSTGSASDSSPGPDGAASIADAADDLRAETGSSDRDQPYIVRRAVQDKSVQFEREERLTFFVHDDVVEGERELISRLEADLGRSVPKFDVREAVYRAALRNPEDVLAELLEMGYSLED